MPTDEKAMNAYLAQAMEKQAPPQFQVHAEQHGAARRGHTSPDIIVRMPYNLRTIIETEYRNPAIADAKKRLGYELKESPTPIKSILAVGIPQRLAHLSHADRDQALTGDCPQFLLQVVTGRQENDPNAKITPQRPITVSLPDLIQYAWLAAIPEAYTTEIIREVVQNLQAAKSQLARSLTLAGPKAQAALIQLYGNHDSANGMESVAGNVVGTLASMTQLHINLKERTNIDQLLPLSDPQLWQKIEPYNAIPQLIARQWRLIENIDYMPLSTIAAGMLENPELAPKLPPPLKTIYQTMTQSIHAGISAATNVVAEIWQALIPDRDERAAYYTKPATAELLANLTTHRLHHPAQAKYNEICAGTGTLARATEENIRFRHYAHSPLKQSIHAQRMERCIQLTDINPQSISVATANMASLEPETTFQSSAIFAITARGGSLNFLTKQGVSGIEDRLIGRNGPQTEMLVIEPRTIGICNNNDPYFRPRGGAKNPIPAKAMQSYKRRADRLHHGIAHGQAGLATFMHVIEHEMLAYGAPHGKVLPLTAAHAETYTGFRRNIETQYSNIIAISTAAGDGASMSADTGIQEMLLIATKQPLPPGAPQPQPGDRAITCINLNTTFITKLDAKMFADAIRREIALNRQSGQITVGIPIGTYYRMTNLGQGKPWSALGTGGDFTSLIEHTTAGRAWHPATGQITHFALPMTTASGVSAHGPTHHLLGCIPTSRDARGAFTMHPATETQNRNNPSLWELQAKTQLQITCQPTHYGEPRDDPAQAQRMLQSAGRFHLSRNLRMSAQKIAMAYTEQDCMGGTGWTTIAADPGVAEAIAIFLNSTYGLLVRIGYGQSTDVGRSRIQVRAINNHPIPDFAAAGEAAQTARRIALDHFHQLRQLPLKRISLSALDPHRAEIDRITTLMLGLPYHPQTENMLHAWRRLMCLQPAVNARNRETLAALTQAGLRPQPP